MQGKWQQWQVWSVSMQVIPAGCSGLGVHALPKVIYGNQSSPSLKWCYKSKKIGSRGRWNYLIQCYIAVKRHHDQDTLIEESISLETCLQFQRCPLSPCRADRHGAGEAAKSYILIRKMQEDKATVGLAWDFENSKPTPTDTLPPAWWGLFQQDHTSSSFSSNASPDD